MYKLFIFNNTKHIILHGMNSIKMNWVYLVHGRVYWILSFIKAGPFLDWWISTDQENPAPRSEWMGPPCTPYLILVLSMLQSSPWNIADSMWRNNLARDQGALMPCSSYVQIFTIVTTLHSIWRDVSTLSRHPGGSSSRWQFPSRWRCCKNIYQTAVNSQLLK